ncbi:MAG: molybdopterin dehydrogenase FAD-binding protein [Frankiales bacterium]|nr:molybdopterin dehydrogenase FAD-binding protein [Frankiales bacterium]
MKLPPFEYRTPETVEETVELLGEFGDEAKILAGGQSLIPLLAMRLSRPAVVIDINNVNELNTISNGSGLSIGALTRHRTAERSALVQSSAPMLVAALGYVGHDAIRTRGTIGGSVAHADPAAELPTVLTALGGSVSATSARGTRSIAADDFFEGFLSTSLADDELLTAIQLPPRPDRSGWSFNEFSRRSGDFALVGVAVSIELDESGTVVDARIAMSGVAGEPTRAIEAETALRGNPAGPESFATAAAAAAAEINPSADLHGTTAYRKHLAGILVRKGLNEACDRAKGTR